MTTTFESLNPGDTIDGPKFAVSRESIRLFCDASLELMALRTAQPTCVCPGAGQLG